MSEKPTKKETNRWSPKTKIKIDKGSAARSLSVLHQGLKNARLHS